MMSNSGVPGTNPASERSRRSSPSGLRYEAIQMHTSALAALAVGLELGLPFSQLCGGITIGFDTSFTKPDDATAELAKQFEIVRYENQGPTPLLEPFEALVHLPTEEAIADR